MNTKKFLTAEWRKLIMANYEVDPGVLTPFLPGHTELDTFNGRHYLSLVGFMFLHTRVMGIRAPFHGSFPEVNLRFYVRHRENARSPWKRGVVFIQEIVPKPILSWVANTLFHEHYLTMPMKHSLVAGVDDMTISYSWKKKNWNSLEVTSALQSDRLQEGSQEEFITEHYWGYTTVDNGQRTGEYRVEHPRWNIYPVRRYRIDCDFHGQYGSGFASLASREPDSVFLAEGSPIAIYHKRII